MPTGTRVHRCVERLKRKGGGGNPFAICQAATGQSFATGKRLRSNMPPHVEQSPKGDIGKHSDMEMQKVFTRKMKGSGKADHASSFLPYHPEPMQGDTPGLSVRTAPKDEVA